MGSYIVTYDVTDSEGNAATQVTRTVDVVDTTAPIITLVGANPQVIEVGSAYVELGATATDNYDGDLTASIVIDASAVDTATVGSYLVTYDVSDSAGNPALAVRTVDVVDTTAPVISPPQDITAEGDEVFAGSELVPAEPGGLAFRVDAVRASMNRYPRIRVSCNNARPAIEAGVGELPGDG